MNLHHLSVFREVMKTGSMSQAAQNLGRTQPAISLALKGLEASLGITLFDRDTRNLKPVPEAFYLLAEAESMLNQMSELQRTMKRMQVGEEGEIQLAVMPGVATVLFPKFLSLFTKDKPEVSLSLHTRSSTQLRELVSSQGVDFGFGDYDEDHSRTLQTRVTKIIANSYLAVPKNHSLARSGSRSGPSYDPVALADLKEVRLGGMLSGHRFEKRVSAALSSAGVVQENQFRSQTVLPLLRFVASGQCCAIVDPLTVLSAEQAGIAENEVQFMTLSTPLIYEYAILIPRLRRLSALSRQLTENWQDYLMSALTNLGAEPRAENLD